MSSSGLGLENVLKNSGLVQELQKEPLIQKQFVLLKVWDPDIWNLPVFSVDVQALLLILLALTGLFET